MFAVALIPQHKMENYQLNIKYEQIHNIQQIRLFYFFFIISYKFVY